MKRLNRFTHKQKGFTLIELVVVIVILGILAVTAAPKFINLQDDARTATLQAIKASMQSASTLVHSKSLIKGNESTATGTVKVNGAVVNIVNGYPKAKHADWTHLLEVDLSLSGNSATTDFKYKELGSDKYAIYPTNETAPTNTNATCMVYYTQATNATTLPVITVNDCT